MSKPRLLSLTEACRLEMDAAGRPLTPIEVRAALRTSGFPIDERRNALASIHSVMKRIAEARPARVHSQVGGHLNMLRDYFAAEAMNAELASSSFGEAARALAAKAEVEDRDIEEQIAVNAYRLADAMIAQRGKGRS